MCSFKQSCVRIERLNAICLESLHISMTNAGLHRKFELSFFSLAVCFHFFLNLEGPNGADRLLLCKRKVRSGAIMRAAAGLSGCDTDYRRHIRDVSLLPSAGQTLKHIVSVKLQNTSNFSQISYFKALASNLFGFCPLKTKELHCEFSSNVSVYILEAWKKLELFCLSYEGLLQTSQKLFSSMYQK